MHSEAIETVAADWVLRRFGDAWTDADQAQLDAWLSESTLQRVAYLRLEAVWQQTARLKALRAGRPAGVVPPPGYWSAGPSQNASNATLDSSQREPLALRRRVALAAGLLLVLLGGLCWAVMQMRVGVEQYATAVGDLRTVRLADGSEVTLNTNTRIRARFKSGERRIELDSGEAYFVVAKDPSRPFVVRVADHSVTAVGTQFSVRRSASGAQVLVTEGRVGLRAGAARSSQAPTMLDAGTFARAVQSEVMVSTVSEADVERLLCWRSGFVVFRNTSLAEAVAELNRYLPRKLVIDDPSLSSIRLGGKFRTNNLDAFLSLLQQGFPVVVEDAPDRIVLKRRT